MFLLNFSMMRQNRRFPFERTKEPILLENFTTTEEQLYPIIRQYTSINRSNDQDKPRHSQQQNGISHHENDRFNQFMNHLQQPRHYHSIDIHDYSALRQDHLQHWKHVRYQWQQYYRGEIQREQNTFPNCHG